MKVELLKCDTIEMTDSALSQCYDQPKHGNTKKGMDRVIKVCNLYKHDSLLEFGSAVWEIESSMKVLLEMTRHRHANYACKSSRFTLNKSEIIYESTGDAEIDAILEEQKKTVLDQLAAGKKNDVVSLMLPAAYQYRWQVQMNFRAMKNFFNLRMDRTAHFQIRAVAEEMLSSLPVESQELVCERKG